ncbi:SIMPL domain-containing protein, partial [Pontiellaceae bacterium B12227]|nr:SIMPL domain-containing protein [Pontiellaceae bacterium B12227]
NVTQVQAEFTSTQKEAVSRALTGEACRKARQEAELLSEASGVKLGGLFAISTDGFTGLETRFKPYISDDNLYGNPLLGDMPLNEESGLPFFAPDTIKYEATVATIYKLK